MEKGGENVEGRTFLTFFSAKAVWNSKLFENDLEYRLLYVSF